MTKPLALARLLPARQSPDSLKWIGLSCIAFLLATAYAIAVVVYRLPALGRDNPSGFRTALALHVELAVFFWLMSSMAGQWIAGARHRGNGTRLPEIAFLGTLILALSPLAGGTPQMVDYFPWLSGNPLFSLGFALFCTAVGVAAAQAAWRWLTQQETPGWQGVGGSAVPALAAAGCLLGDLANGARDLSTLAWGCGHVLLFAHVTMLSWEWRRLTGTDTVLTRAATRWLLACALVLAATSWIVPPESPEHRQVFTWAMTWLLWPPVLGILASAFWKLHRNGGRAPAGLLISAALMAAGLALGAAIDGATTLVTAHYHATMGAVAISRMAFLYTAPRTLNWRRPEAGSARRQLACYGMGLALLAAGLAIAALEHAPRKTAATELTVHGPAYRLGMSISGLGGLFAMAGSLWLVINLTGGRPKRQCSHAVVENRRQKCHPRASTATVPAASSQGGVQS